MLGGWNGKCGLLDSKLEMCWYGEIGHSHCVGQGGNPKKNRTKKNK